MKLLAWKRKGALPATFFVIGQRHTLRIEALVERAEQTLACAHDLTEINAPLHRISKVDYARDIHLIVDQNVSIVEVPMNNAYPKLVCGARCHNLGFKGINNG
jgi:hypothetical protein